MGLWCGVRGELCCDERIDCGVWWQALFDEVHRSNMSKACATVSEAEATCRRGPPCCP